MQNKVYALLQARSDSSRLPGKVLKNILDKPMIIHQLERTSRSKLIDKLILVTSNEESDNQLAKIIQDNKYTLFRGDKNNVLKRFYDSLSTYNLDDNDIIVRLTGDCPLHDPEIIDELIEEFQNQKYDYLANCIEPIYPDGLDVEVFNYKALKSAYKNATTLVELEHVTPYIRADKNLNIKNFKKKPLHNNWRLTVDESEDFHLISKIYKHFNSNSFSFEELISYLEANKDLLNINSHINRNEGYIKSLEKGK